MSLAFLDGPIAPVYSIFAEDGRLDPEGQRRFLDFLVARGGISAYFIRSGLGQMYTFSFEEAEVLIRTACRHLAGLGPVLAGASGIWDRDYQRLPDPRAYTEQAVALSRCAEEAGAAGVVLTLPEGLAPEQGEAPCNVILRYVGEVAAAVALPVFLYQPPGTLPAYCATPGLVARLAAMPHLAGIKVSTPDAATLFDLRWAVRNTDFAIIAGAETVYYPALAMGIRAVIGQGCTTNPRILRAVARRYDAGNLDGAMAAQHSVNQLVRAVRHVTEFTKRYATEKGYPVSPHPRRSPGDAGLQEPPLTGEEYARAKATYEAECARYGDD